MATDEDVAAGLINWVNSLQVTGPVYTVDDLATGEALWKLLQLVDHLAFSSSLPEDPSRIDTSNPQQWIPKWSNLKHVNDALSLFLIEECGQTVPIFSHAGTTQRVNPDLKAIAQHGSLLDMVLLLKSCVVAATTCADNRRFLEGMQELPEAVQRVLMETITETHEVHDDEEEEEREEEEEHIEHREIEDDDYDGDEEHQQDLAQTSHIHNEDDKLPGGASELAFEERLAKVIADGQRIQREKLDVQRNFDDLSARYSLLAERFDKSQDELGQTSDRLTAVLSGRSVSTAEGSDVQKDAIILQLESQIASYETDIEQLRKTNEVLKIKAERTQKLQDDYDEVKIERDNLSRRANAAEKYRLKLEASGQFEKENTTLKQKIADLQGQLRQSDTRTASTSDLQRENDEYRRLLPSIEQERHELNEMKKRLEFDYHRLEARYSEREEELRRSRAELEDLQGRLRDYNDDGDPGSRRTTGGEVSDGEEVGAQGKDLETEEADFDAAEASLNEALSRAEAAAAITDSSLTTPVATSGDPGTAVNAVMEGLDLEENGVSEHELRAIMSAMRAQMAAGTSLERESALKMQKRMVVMLEKARSKNENLVNHIRKQNDVINELQQRPAKSLTGEDATKSQREGVTEQQLEIQLEEQNTMIENLKREIRLVSSAWYEQNQRLATLGSGSGGGAVALMRLKCGHVEEPKSFLGRQRKMLDRVTAGMPAQPMVGNRG